MTLNEPVDAPDDGKHQRDQAKQGKVKRGKLVRVAEGYRGGVIMSIEKLKERSKERKHRESV